MVNNVTQMFLWCIQQRTTWWHPNSWSRGKTTS